MIVLGFVYAQLGLNYQTAGKDLGKKITLKGTANENCRFKETYEPQMVKPF
jgi:hypothetical protein